MGLTGRVGILVQARAGGRRFPGKVLKPLLGQPMLLWQLDRLSQVTHPHTIIVICPDTEGNEAIVELCWAHGYQAWMYKGPEEDVLGRYYQAAEGEQIATIVRITGDCPLIDPGIIDRMLTSYGAMTTHPDHLGIGAPSFWPDGQDCEVFPFRALQIAYDEATLPSDREHVTPFLYHNPDRFLCLTLPCPFNLSTQGYSVDTQEDMALVSILLTRCLTQYGPRFGWRDINTVLQTHALARRLHKARGPRNAAYQAQIAKEKAVQP